jgi:hypothetical protein
LVDLGGGLTYTLFFPLELTNKDYLRRVLEIVTRGISGSVVRITSEKKLEDLVGDSAYDVYYLLKQILAPAMRGGDQLAHRTAYLSTAESHITVLVDAACHLLVPDSARLTDLSATFRAAELLLQNFGAPAEPAVVELRALKAQFDAHRKFKEARMASFGWAWGGDEGGAADDAPAANAINDFATLDAAHVDLAGRLGAEFNPTEEAHTSLVRLFLEMLTQVKGVQADKAAEAEREAERESRAAVAATAALLPSAEKDDLATVEDCVAKGAKAEDALLARTVGSGAASLPPLGADLALPLAALRAKALGLAGQPFGSLADRFASLVVRSDAGGDSSNNKSGLNGGLGSPATDAAWAAMDCELADREAGGWEVTAAAVLLRLGVRDRPSLTADADPRSQVLVELLRRLVLQREGARPDDPAVLNGGVPAPSAASVAADAAAGGAAAAVPMSYPVQRSLSKNNSANDGKQEALAPAAKVVVAAEPAEAAVENGSAVVTDLCDPDIVTDTALLNKFRKSVALRAVASADTHAAAPAAPVTAASVPSTVRAACEELRRAVGDGSDAWRTLRKIVANIVKVQRFLS